MSDKKFGRNSTALEVIEGHDLTGYEIIVTGGAAGIGIETCRAFAKANARVIIAGRDLSKVNAVVDELKKDTGNEKIEAEKLDLASLKSVRDFVERFLAKKRHLNILVNNAGIMACPLEYTEDGFESQFGTNHIGHFVLTKGLLEPLKEAAKKTNLKSRIINLSSVAHARSDVDFDDPNYKIRSYDKWLAYGQSKTANSLFTVELNNRYFKDGIVSLSVMPGVILTGLMKHLSREEQIQRGWMDEEGNYLPNEHFKTIPQGASSTVWAAVASEFETKGGLYLENCQIGELKQTPQDCFKKFEGYLSHALDSANAEKLWSLSEKLVDSLPNKI